MTDTAPRISLWGFIRREPLVHFLGIAVLLFVASAIFSGDDRELIVVDWPTQEFLITQREDLQMRPLTEAERQELVNNIIEEEIFVREARKRGFDSSSRIRSLLIQNMRFFITNGLPVPTEEDLLAFFAANPEEFSTTPTTSYDHVRFADADTVPPDTLERLRSGADHRTMGDVSGPVSPRLLQVAEPTIALTFGIEVAPKVLALDDEDWHGPFISAQGAHFLRITERHPSRRPDFEDIRSWVEAEWTRAESRKLIDAELESLTKDYRIEVLGPDGELD